MKPADWAKHINAINAWHEDAFQQDIIWKKNIVNRSYHGEDDNYRDREIILKGLVSYNFFRSWPIDQPTDTGELDKQNCMAIFNIKWLEEQGHLNEHKQLKFDPGDDKFIINGITYVPAGDSQVSQAYDDPLMIFIILKREEIETGNERY